MDSKNLPWQDDPVTAAHYVLFIAEGADTGAKQPGSFAEMLVRAMFHADRENAGRFMLAFPVFMDAVIRYKTEENGHLELRELAGLS